MNGNSQHRTHVAVLLFWLLVLPACLGAGAEERQSVIIVVGAAGAEEFSAPFREWAERWQAAAIRGGCDVTLIGQEQDTVEAGSDSPPAATAPSTGADVTDLVRLKQAISERAGSSTSEPLWLILIGHGTFDSRQTSFGLTGPDISATELADVCQSVSRPLAVVCCFSSSAPFVNALSGENRVIVSATKDANQLQYSRFGDAMSAGISGLDADIDRDGQSSLLEAWLFAARRTAEFYVSEGRLATEHSLLDDNADQRGSRSEMFDGVRLKPDVKQPETVDGRLAARWHLIRSDEERRLTSEQRQQRDELEGRLELLRSQRATLTEEQYLQALEEILVPLAEIYAAADQPVKPE